MRTTLLVSLREAWAYRPASSRALFSTWFTCMPRPPARSLIPAARAPKCNWFWIAGAAGRRTNEAVNVGWKAESAVGTWKWPKAQLKAAASKQGMAEPDGNGRTAEEREKAACDLVLEGLHDGAARLGLQLVGLRLGDQLLHLVLGLRGIHQALQERATLRQLQIVTNMNYYSEQIRK